MIEIKYTMTFSVLDRSNGSGMENLFAPALVSAPSATSAS